MTHRKKYEKLIEALDIRDANQRKNELIADVEATLGRFANGYTAMIRQFIRESN